MWIRHPEKNKGDLPLGSKNCHEKGRHKKLAYVVVTAWSKLPVSWPIICCPKLQKHIECTRDISFWFSYMWQQEPTIVWCFVWYHYWETDYARFFYTYFGGFFQSHQGTSQYCNIQSKYILDVNDSPRTIFQSSFTCTFQW